MAVHPISDLYRLIKTMEPVLNAGSYVFATVPNDQSVPLDVVIASIRETEGLSLIVEEACAHHLGLKPLFQCAWITLSVHSDLAAIGLTAAFSSALTEAGISCNVVAGALHDHIFVPVAQADAAMSALKALQQRAADAGG